MTDTKDVTSKYELLKKEIYDMSEKTANWSEGHKSKSFWIYMGIAFSSSCITFLVAIGDDLGEDLHFAVKCLTLIFSACSALLAAWDGFFNHKELWVNYSETRNHLRTLLFELKMLKEEDRDDDKVLNRFYSQYKDIVHESNSKWKELRTDD
ncbi:DUF4231 domain-containing protein [Flammeovirga yaeyamensis]|uniref:DUF4231 domain-containing protein n=1 Tax=Flammeovirga yaeyamensis TaxID=367791 RepID=A0AAX1NDF0_9BACT|nr:DUF4231 domain-containing protein [Flammeovirga yaeyamensis]MBB3699302.1 hypothetical protein [Flammeovirga yaeyamensis]NMF35435.1 DUF4231 domain-containing protein [Flammeovirga yaeyamensis]QWG04295.1 DUF4231 domain-containing protein [Flammeovirga yaeyamensis]